MAKKIEYKEKLISNILKQANIGICSYDVVKKTITWSPNLKNLLGFTKKPYKERFDHFLKRIYFLDRERISNKVKEVLKKENKFYMTFRIEGKDGKLHWLSSNGLVSRDDKGKPVEINGVCIDISRSKNLEKELKKTIAQLRTVFSSVPVGMTVELRSGTIMYANEEFSKLFSLDNSGDFEVSGKNIRKLLKEFKITDENGTNYKPSQLPASEVFKGKKKATKVFSFENPKTGNVKWLKITATAVDSQTLPTEMVIKIFQNVTRESEEKQSTLNSLGMASHELKNALASLKAYVQLVKRRLLKNDIQTALSYAETLDTQSLRLTKLINDLLDVSRIQSGLLKLSKKQLDYSWLVKNIVADFKHSQQDHIFTVKIKSDIKLFADEDRIVQVLINLLSNAVKYSKKGTKIDVAVYPKDSHVITKIKDRGVGIANSEKKTIFNLFIRGKSKYVRSTKGMGIGLYTSNAIVKEHGGEISFKSKTGYWTTFVIKLPLTESD